MAPVLRALLLEILLVPKRRFSHSIGLSMAILALISLKLQQNNCRLKVINVRLSIERSILILLKHNTFNRGYQEI